MNLEPRRNVYVGHRYVPKIMGEWSKANTYEGLSIVTFEGASYTSKKHVPAGIDIKNEVYWVLTGNYNAQIEYYRKDVERVEKDTDNKLIDFNDRLEKIELNIEFFGAVGDGVSDDTTFIERAIEYAKENNVEITLDKNYKADGNIDDFLGTFRENKNIYNGNGSIERDGNIFYINPKGSQTNTIYVSDNINADNDGLSKNSPTTLDKAVTFISSLKEKLSDGHWKIKFIGTYSGVGFRNAKLPYLKNPMILEGERDNTNKITSIIDGVKNHDAYFFRMDTGSTFQKSFEIKDLIFKNFNRDVSGAGAIVCWDNVDLYVHDCESYNNSRFLWVRNGRVRCINNIMDGGHSGVTCQYHTTFNVEYNTIKNTTSYGVHAGRNSAGHFTGNIFSGNYINIEGTQSTRLRVIENNHIDWKYTGINLYLNATCEGIENEIITFKFPIDLPFTKVFYGSGMPINQKRTSMNRQQYSFPNTFLNLSTAGTYNLNNLGFDSVLRTYRSLLKSETVHVNIKYIVQAPGAMAPATEFDIILSVTDDIETQFLKIPIVTENIMNGEIDINIYSKKGTAVKYIITKYPDGDKVKTHYQGINLQGVFTGDNTLLATRTHINHKKGIVNILGIITEISE